MEKKFNCLGGREIVEENNYISANIKRAYEILLSCDLSEIPVVRKDIVIMQSYILKGC